MTVVLLWICVALPALGALLARAAGRRSATVAALGAAASALPAWALLVTAGGGQRASSTFTWLPAGGGLDVGLRLDGLSAAMSATVASVGLVVLVYSAGYFAAHPRGASARAGLLAFLAAMQGLVLADGFLTLLVFWELVGALSARLIAFSRDDPAAPGGAVRAFLTTRTADVGFYVALLALYAGAGTLAFGAERPDGALGALVGLGLVLAAMGKSAQAPLQTWLGGAMAGPTPVSALLHLATMVAAGVYLLARAHDLLAGWPLAVAGWVGAVTAVAGAVIALGQSDLKRVLAGSTTSQLGLMFVGVAAGGPAVALFHLVTHAAGKAALFLATGIFQHRRDTTELDGLRGVGAEDRAAFAAFALAALSIAGIPPLAAFWSKDALVIAADGELAWLILVLVASAGSAAYLLRPALLLWRAAPGTPAGRAPAGRGAMLAGTGALALAGLGLGAVGTPLAELLGGALPEASPLGIGLSLGATTVGAGAALIGLRPPEWVARAARRQLYGNDAVASSLQRPVLALAALATRLDDAALDVAVDGIGRRTLALARFGRRVDEHAVDAAVDGSARGTMAFARLERRVEERVIDAGIDRLAALVKRGGRDTTRLQTGRLYEYLRDTVAGIAAIALIFALASLL